MGGCTRVARWCVWLNPAEGKRGTNALTYYYEISAGLHSRRLAPAQVKRQIGELRDGRRNAKLTQCNDDAMPRGRAGNDAKR
jgi:hypothetical protein